LLVPFAACAAAGCAEALPRLELPHLRRLLARLGPPATDAGSADSLSPPHERALARSYGLDQADGLIPLAAWQLRQEGHDTGDGAWAWITPCHWRVGQTQILMAHPNELQLDADDSRALLAAMAPYFAEDGIRLEYQAPTRWLAQGELFRTLPAASLDRVIGRNLDSWMPGGNAGRPLRRLQQEMQMLLYTLPLNDARQRGGLLPVNSFWVSGSGALPLGTQAQVPSGLRLSPYLRDAALHEDWAGWESAWQQLDNSECARLAADLDGGREVRITLCGEANARSWSTPGASLWQRVGAAFSRPSAARVLETL
jgi:hypothetical protein